MDIESEHLGIPETEYKCTVRLPAAEFQRIIRGEKERKKYQIMCKKYFLCVVIPTHDYHSKTKQEEIDIFVQKTVLLKLIRSII